MPGIKTYLVGGAVRDEVMGQMPADRDYVVVGATPAQMRGMGYEQVGADFPVFLHPETRYEYALARTERKTGAGYKGFETRSEGVTLEEDLLRRDLTCNAMARAEDGTLIDPHGGVRDIRARILRHTSEAFREDPVRVLRTARFAAKLGFDIAPETSALAREMVRGGELDHLVPERVAQELVKSLSQPTPSRFFTALDEMGALEKLFPEVHALKGQTQPARHHAEGDAFAHTMMVVDSMRQIAIMEDIAERATGGGARIDVPLNVFCALAHDLGKGLTPKERLPAHHGHEAAGVPLVEALCRRLRLPKAYLRVASKCAEYHGHVHRVSEMTPRAFNRLFDATGGRNAVGDLEVVARVAQADAAGRITDPPRSAPYVEHQRFREIMRAIAAVKITDAHAREKLAEMAPDRISGELRRLRAGAVRATRRGLGIG